MNTLSRKEVAKRFAARGFVLLGAYKNNHTPVKTRCRCGKVFFPTPTVVFDPNQKTSCGCVRKASNSVVGDQLRKSQAEVEREFEAKGIRLRSTYVTNCMPVDAECSCGRLFSVFPSSVSRARHTIHCKDCRKQQQAKNIEGIRFGRLLALKPLPKTGHITQWICRCDCGTERAFALNNLTTGHTKSCGCDKLRMGNLHPRWRGHGQIPKTMWWTIVNSARSRHKRFALTVEYCWELFQQQSGTCALTGVDLQFAERRSARAETTASLDEIDRNRGYVPGNVQWVHKIVNLMKHRLSEERFLQLCRLVLQPLRHRCPSPHCTITRKHPHFRGHGNIGIKKWNAIRANAKTRGYAFEVSITQGWKQFLKQQGWCALTGLEIDWASYVGKNAKGEQGNYGGTASLDRIDSSRSIYDAENIQWVHKDVNLMKWKLGESEFKKWCALVAARNAS